MSSKNTKRVSSDKNTKCAPSDENTKCAPSDENTICVPDASGNLVPIIDSSVKGPVSFDPSATIFDSSIIFVDSSLTVEPISEADQAHFDALFSNAFEFS